MPDKTHIKTIINCDPGSSKDIAARHMLHSIDSCDHYGHQPIRFTTINGVTPWFKEMGILRIKDSKDKNVSVLCYAQDTEVQGHPNFVIISNNTLVDMETDMNYQMKASKEQGAIPLKRLTEKVYRWHAKGIPQERKPDSVRKLQQANLLQHNQDPYGHTCGCSPRIVDTIGLDVYLEHVKSHKRVQRAPMSVAFLTESSTSVGYANHDDWDDPDPSLPIWEPVDAAMPDDILKDLGKYRCFMTEIQLQALLDRTSTMEGEDMDLTTIDGKRISKFDLEAIRIGKLVPDELKKRFKKFNQNYIGKDSVFPTQNGAPRILTQFKDEPYSLELLDQCTTGAKPKRLPTIRGTYYTGKPATMKIMEHFVRTTPVVERCDDPRCLSRLVIVPKLDPGMPKDTPPTSYRVTMNAIINDCLKPVASTLPLATDEIQKLHGYKYFIKADAMHAYWAIPLDEESKKLLAFQTHEGVFAWNRLTMGCRPSSQVQQTAFHKAMDDHLPRQYRQRLALFADDLAAGANSLEELFEIYQALIIALHKAGIQLKASKVEFGNTKCTFHNYTVVGGDGPDANTTTPKSENLDPIANSTIPQTVTQMKAFLGATQQLAFYVPQYGIAAHPLHHLTKKNVTFPAGDNWIPGSDYDIAYHHVKSMMTDTPLYLFNKVHNKPLFIEVDSSHEGWGAVIYQYAGKHPEGQDSGRHYLFSKEPKRVIKWISKAWSPYDRALPCFYKETIARLLALEAFRNLIETQTAEAGVTCYSDHLPSIKESSLSNKGKLSTWKIHETSDLNSIVQTIWKKGATMSTADPLSRLSRREHRLNNLDLPLLLKVLLDKLPPTVKNAKRMRVNAEKDDAVATRIVQKWRNPSNVICNTRGNAPGQFDFLITAPFADKITHKIADLIRNGVHFAALMPLSLLNETDRNADGSIDELVRSKRQDMQVIVIASLGVAWLVNHPERKVSKDSQHHVLFTQQYEYPEAASAAQQGFETWIEDKNLTDVISETSGEELQVLVVQAVDDLMRDGAQRSFPVLLGQTTTRITRSNAGQNTQHTSLQDKTPNNSARDGRARKRTKTTPFETPCVRNKEHELFKFARAPKPLPIKDWVGKQTLEIPPSGRILEKNEYPKGFPAELLMVMDKKNRRLVSVPMCQRLILTRYSHDVLLHQKGLRVLHDLENKYYWPNMEQEIKEICAACKICLAAGVRRQRIDATFKIATSEGLPMPRQNYGIDFYGHAKGEILVAMDLCTREVLLWFIPNRKQDGVAKALLTGLIFQKGVPLTFRNDEASEFVKGTVAAMNRYLGIDNISTGGYNPRANANVERFMQTLNACLRKCSDKEYTNIVPYLQAIAFAHNTTFNSTINCTPFECGHGLRARSITDARMSPRLQLIDEEGKDMDQSIVQWESSLWKGVLQLTERLTDEANKQSQWHKRMTASRLNQSGKKIEDHLLENGASVYFYRPPNREEVIRRGRKTKHIGHYVGPATIVEKIGERQYAMTYKNKPFTRDVGMIIPESQLPEKFAEYDPAEEVETARKPTLHQKDSPMIEGELVLTRDGIDNNSRDWYVAEVTHVYKDRIKVTYFSTPTPPLVEYTTASEAERKTCLEHAHFRKTWFLKRGKNAGQGTTSAPFPTRPEDRLWTGPLPTEELNQAILVRNVSLTAGGKLSKETLNLACKLGYPHNKLLTIEDAGHSMQLDPPAMEVTDPMNNMFNYAQYELCACKNCKLKLIKGENTPSTTAHH